MSAADTPLQVLFTAVGLRPDQFRRLFHLLDDNMPSITPSAVGGQVDVHVPELSDSAAQAVYVHKCFIVQRMGLLLASALEQPSQAQHLQQQPGASGGSREAQATITFCGLGLKRILDIRQRAAVMSVVQGFLQ